MRLLPRRHESHPKKYSLYRLFLSSIIKSQRQHFMKGQKSHNSTNCNQHGTNLRKKINAENPIVISRSCIIANLIQVDLQESQDLSC